MRRAQEKLIADLEGTVMCRETIFERARTWEKRSGPKAKQPRINYARKIDDLRNKVQKSKLQIEDFDKEIAKIIKENEETIQETKNVEEETQELHNKVEEAMMTLEEAKTDKQKVYVWIIFLKILKY